MKPSLRDIVDISTESIGTVLLSEFYHYQKLGLYCDVCLITPGYEGPPVNVHSLVIAAACPKLGTILNMNSKAGTNLPSR